MGLVFSAFIGKYVESFILISLNTIVYLVIKNKHEYYNTCVLLFWLITILVSFESYFMVLKGKGQYYPDEL